MVLSPVHTVTASAAYGYSLHSTAFAALRSTRLPDAAFDGLDGHDGPVGQHLESPSSLQAWLLWAAEAFPRDPRFPMYAVVPEHWLGSNPIPNPNPDPNQVHWHAHLRARRVRRHRAVRRAARPRGEGSAQLCRRAPAL